MHSPSAKPPTTASIASAGRLDMTLLRVEADRIHRSEQPDWHSGSELNDRARAFHDKFARQPPGIDEAKGIHTRYMREIEVFLRREGCCSRIEYTGSTYEGVKVPKEGDDLEFDIMVVMDGSLLVAENTIQPGFVRLTSRSQHDRSRLPSILSASDGELYFDAQKVYNKFFGHVQKCINQSAEMCGKVKLVRHGPATQIDVYRQRDASARPIGPKFYSVDIVPAFDIGNGRIFVAKQKVNDQEETRAMTSFWWRESFSVSEKQKLEAADRNNGCRKQVFRILKVIRNREPTLSPLTSYHLKTALFREMDKSGLSWTYNDVGKRLMGVLEVLDRQLSAGQMPHYYVDGINLLDGMSSITIENIKGRISRLRMSEIEMKRVLA